jgi:sugar phosphate permease
LLGVGIRVVGSTGVFYSTMTAIVETEEIGAATAGGQTAINVGGLVGPPAFGFLADTVSYEAGWALLAGVGLIATLLFVALRSR